jgi:hypothetical protein
MRYKVVFLSFAALLAACSNRISCEDSELAQLGINGAWEIYQRTDTVTLLPGFVQGEDLKLLDDSICDDLHGLWDYNSTSSENGGEFVVDTAMGEITFFTPTYSFRWEYVVVDYDNLVFRYNDGGVEIKELWRRK